MGKFVGMMGGAALAMLATSALAQDNALYFSPQMQADLTAPSAFDGLYAGVLLGPISARKNNFSTGGADLRPEFGAVVGWNQPVMPGVMPGVVLGGEVQGSVATDLAGSAYLRAMALARLGFAAGDNTLIYLLGGVGSVGGRWAYEFGAGAEVAVAEALTVRLEAAGIGQLGDLTARANIPAISAIRVTSGLLWQLDGGPAATGFNSGPVTDFSGFYAGINLGGLTDPQFNFYNDNGFGWHLSRFEIGGLAGYNHALNDTFRVGVEAQLGFNFDTSGDSGIDGLALARVGVVPTEGVHVYAAAGLGMVEAQASYAFGGGVDYALWGQASLRGEALLLGRLDGAPGLTGVAGPSSSKVTIGTVWHFD